MYVRDFREESIWHKTSLDNTVGVIYFVHAVPIGKEETFGPMLAVKIKYFFDVTRKRKTNTTGRLALDWYLYLPLGPRGGLGKFCLDKGTTKRAQPKKW